MLIDFEPGDFVKNPANIDWGIGQVQSIVATSNKFGILEKGC